MFGHASEGEECTQSRSRGTAPASDAQKNLKFSHHALYTNTKGIFLTHNAAKPGISGLRMPQISQTHMTRQPIFLFPLSGAFALLVSLTPVRPASRGAALCTPWRRSCISVCAARYEFDLGGALIGMA